MKVVLLSVCLVLMASLVLGAASTQQRSSVCQAHVSCISKVLRASHICGGEMLCKQVCEDLEAAIDSALDTTFFWDKNCGAHADSARYVLQASGPALVNALAAASGCGEQACEARLRFGQMAAVCASDADLEQLLADSLCNSHLALALDDARLHHARNVVAYTPEGSIGTAKSPSTTGTKITAGREAGDIIGFIVLCALIIACVIPMTVLFFRWLFLTIKNFDGQAFMARFGK